LELNNRENCRERSPDSTTVALEHGQIYGETGGGAQRSDSTPEAEGIGENGFVLPEGTSAGNQFSRSVQQNGAPIWSATVAERDTFNDEPARHVEEPEVGSPGCSLDHAVQDRDVITGGNWW